MVPIEIKEFVQAYDNIKGYRTNVYTFDFRNIFFSNNSHLYTKLEEYLENTNFDEKVLNLFYEYITASYYDKSQIDNNKIIQIFINKIKHFEISEDTLKILILASICRGQTNVFDYFINKTAIDKNKCMVYALKCYSETDHFKEVSKDVRKYFVDYFMNDAIDIYYKKGIFLLKFVVTTPDLVIICHFVWKC